MSDIHDDLAALKEALKANPNNGDYYAINCHGRTVLAFPPHLIARIVAWCEQRMKEGAENVPLAKQLEEYESMAKSAQQSPASEWVFVPREPTETMWAAHGVEENRPDDFGAKKYRRAIWNCMLAAAPVRKVRRMTDAELYNLWEGAFDADGPHDGYAPEYEFARAIETELARRWGVEIEDE